MSLLVVTYRTRPELARDNQSEVVAVFDELAEREIDGMRYACMRLGDDRFVHVADVVASENPLLGLESFSRFSSTVGARCAPGEGPDAQPAVLVGNHRLLA